MISIIIPSRNESSALWATIASARADLETSPLEWEIIAVVSQPFPPLVYHIAREDMATVVFADALSPQAARHEGVARSKGETIFFLDAHVIVPDGFFCQMLGDMKRTGAAMMHSPHRFLGRTAYGFRVGWDEYLWSTETIREAPAGSNPYKVAIMGHGACAIRRDAYLKAGGYWQELKGFGGEETQLNLKLWLMGMQCWATPRTHHWHYLPQGERHNETLFRDRDFVRNYLMIAAAYAGVNQVISSYDALRRLHWGGENLYPEIVAPILASDAVNKERKFIEEHGKYKSIDALREMFVREGVVN